MALEMSEWLEIKLWISNGMSLGEISLNRSMHNLLPFSCCWEIVGINMICIFVAN